MDPGLATVGLGVIEQDTRGENKAIDWLTITTKAGISASERLAEIRNDLSSYIRKMKPDLAVVERLYFSKNEKTAFAVAEARGVILLTLAEHALPFLEPNPLTLKSCIAGSGRAGKAEVQDMLVRTLHLKEIPHPDDASDALALALFGAMQNGILLNGSSRPL
ncbi:MAG: crossover junction endodeoxyribonuclease RuvC [Candidatus Peregrinibacteria bacterium]